MSTAGVLDTGGDPTGKISGTESSLSNWAGPYVTNMLGMGQALAQSPYQAYTGPLTAGPTAGQQAAFQGIANLAVPTSIGQAATTAGQVATQAGQMGFDPTQFTSQFQAPTNLYQAGAGLGGIAQQAGQMGYSPTDFASQYQTPGDIYQAGTIASGYQTPADIYRAGQITTGAFTPQAAQQYMDPFVQAALNPQLREAKRAAEEQRIAQAGRLSQAGAFGGSRQAIMESELSRNLAENLSDITGRGYSEAFQRAQQAFTQDQARALQAQQAQEAARQAQGTQALSAAQQAAQFGLTAQQAQEAARQAQGTQALSAAQQAAQFGQTAAQAGEASRQFGAGFGLDALGRQLEAQRAQEAAMQAEGQQALTAAQQAAQFGQAAQAAAEQSRQFGAGFGLDALRQQLAGAQAQGALGRQELQSNIDVLGEQARLGGQEYALNQAAIDAARRQFEEERLFPYKQVQFMQSLLQGLPLEAQQRSYVEPSQFSQLSANISAIQDAIDFLTRGGSGNTPGTGGFTPTPGDQIVAEGIGATLPDSGPADLDYLDDPMFNT